MTAPQPSPLQVGGPAPCVTLDDLRVEHVGDTYRSWLADPEVMRYLEARFRTHTLDEIRASRQGFAARMAALQGPSLTPGPIATEAYDFLLPKLQADPANLLCESRKTRDALVLLGRRMGEPSSTDARNSEIPAAYTYFGQFVDHDITLEAHSATLPDLVAEGLTPLTLADIATKLRNGRTSSLDLDECDEDPLLGRDEAEALRVRRLEGAAEIGHRPLTPCGGGPGRGGPRSIGRWDSPHP